jgi:hypothetical protein
MRPPESDPPASDAPTTDAPTTDPPALMPPSNVQATTSPTWGRCHVSWAPAAAPVDGYELQSDLLAWQIVNAPGHSVPASQISAELDFGSWNPELSRPSIQIRSVRGAERSAFSEPVICVIPIRPPSSLIAVVTNDGVSVQWGGFSQVATGFVVERSVLDAAGIPIEWFAAATLPFLPGDFDVRYSDATPVPGNAYGYRITATNGHDISAPAVTTTLVLGPQLRAQTIQLPLARSMASDGNGHFAYHMRPPGTSGTLRFIWGDGTQWTSATTQVAIDALGHDIYPPGIKLDTAGLPHAVYGQSIPSSDNLRLVHGWSDGTRWHEEAIADRPLFNFSGQAPLRFDLDPSGNAVVGWLVRGVRLEAATEVAGVWTVHSLETVYPDVSHLQTFDVFADHTGAIHLLVADFDGIHHLQRQAGVWTSELLTPPNANLSFYDSLLGVGQDPDHLAVFFEISGPGIATRAAVLRKTLAGWGATEVLGALPFTGAFWNHAVAQSADGGRLALVTQSGNAQTTFVFRSDRGGAWSQSLAHPLQFLTPGFDASGKLFVFSATNDDLDHVVIGTFNSESEP